MRDYKELSPEGRKILQFMLKEMCSLGYIYKTHVEGCFEMAITAYGFKRPPEDKEEIIEIAIDKLEMLVNGINKR
jgi:hypothetical protein